MTVDRRNTIGYMHDCISATSAHIQCVTLVMNPRTPVSPLCVWSQCATETGVAQSVRRQRFPADVLGTENEQAVVNNLQ